jgi:hypothetical protein
VAKVVTVRQKLATEHPSYIIISSARILEIKVVTVAGLNGQKGVCKDFIPWWVWDSRSNSLSALKVKAKKWRWLSSRS